MIMAANTMADTAMISAILVRGVLHLAFDSLNTAVMSDPTRLIATKKNEIGNVDTP